MDQYIRSTIAMQRQSLIRGKDSVHDKLKVLSSRFATNPYYRIRHLFQRWYSFIKIPLTESAAMAFRMGKLPSWGPMNWPYRPRRKGHWLGANLLLH